MNTAAFAITAASLIRTCSGRRENNRHIYSMERYGTFGLLTDLPLSFSFIDFKIHSFKTLSLPGKAREHKALKYAGTTFPARFIFVCCFIFNHSLFRKNSCWVGIMVCGAAAGSSCMEMQKAFFSYLSLRIPTFCQSILCSSTGLSS